VAECKRLEDLVACDDRYVAECSRLMALATGLPCVALTPALALALALALGPALGFALGFALALTFALALSLLALALA